MLRSLGPTTAEMVRARARALRASPCPGPPAEIGPLARCGPHASVPPTPPCVPQDAAHKARDRWFTLQGFQMGFVERVDVRSKIAFEDVKAYDG